ncbi:PREDICTED: uncharacterized protein LOC104732747 [Camelina sativa]|uniref:Uncharacterized protein LOC104732747 n=1 Tax=Camelina sativa TaxID=90675 RepID=A0ABM0V4H5_CAMSA|nr:PREDICTED: uncharacterized protein LOC104732747 [Camelina sativa]
MKREGKQHGMVRTYRVLPPSLNPRPESKLVNPLTSRPTAGLFTKVSSKPTNHSKFTGKCGQARCLECHMHPITKSKAKTKGSSKVRSSDVSYKMLTWQVASGREARPGLKLSGFSATGILDLMSDDYGYDHDDEYDEEDEEEEDENRGCVVEEIVKIQSDDDDDGQTDEDISHEDDDDEGRMSFCDVGMMMMMEHVEEFDEEGWCLVEEMMT